LEETREENSLESENMVSHYTVDCRRSARDN